MSNDRDQIQMFDLLDATLDTFGADHTRWPHEVWVKLEPLIASNMDARRRVGEARALDHVLRLAPSVPAARQAALVDRIVAAAERQPRMVATSNVPARRIGNPLRRNSWAVGALAASLVLGLLAGQLPVVNSITATALGDEVAGQQVAQSLDVDSLWDEDLL